MAAKKKKSTRGGARQGAGRKKTGVTTVGIGFTVHKDYAEVIKETVRAKVKELKEASPNNLKSVTTSDARIPVVKETKPVSKIKIQGNDFLERRRNAKLGIK